VQARLAKICRRVEFGMEACVGAHHLSRTLGVPPLR
jgi:hypothetical protein